MSAAAACPRIPPTTDSLLRPWHPRPRASRQDNLSRELAPLARSSSNSAEFYRACRALSRAITQRRIPPERAAVLMWISKLIREAHRAKQDDAFLAGHGPAWDKIRHLCAPEEGAHPERTQ
jgi:hypothetical protein